MYSVAPNYEDFYGPDIENAFTTAGILGIVLIVLLAIIVVALILSIVSYVLSALGMYTIAKRRGINNPWLAWIPFGNTWILGSISDQYRYVAKGEVRNRRTLLLGMQIGTVALGTIMQVLNAILTFAAGTNEAAAVGMSLITMGLALAIMVVAIVNSVFLYIAYYDLFRSCKPDNAVLFLVLSIVISYALPILVFICRNKDLGMPPLKTVEAEIVDAPQDPPEE